MNSEHKNGAKAGAVIAGIAGLTAAAVGAYYLYGSKDAAKNRAKVRGWMLKAKGEVIEELEKAEDVTESGYMSAVNAIVAKYRQIKSIDPHELTTFMQEMRDHWNGIKTTLLKAPGRATKRASAKKPAAASRKRAGKK